MLKSDQLLELVLSTLDEQKANEVKVLDVRELTSVTDYMVIASGTSNRHVKALAVNVVEKAKEQEHQPMGTEGENAAEWVLVDLYDVVVHIMLPRVRDFYQLEKLWSGSESPADRVERKKKKSAS